MADNRTCIVTNRYGGPVTYRVPEMHVSRTFEPHEVKKGIPFEELNAVSMQPGGRALLRNYLFVQDEAIVNELFNTDIRAQQPEYMMSEEELVKWMPTCSLDQFKDALDYAPEGMLDLIKRYAVSMPLKDLDKLEAIKEQLDFDVQEAIRFQKESQEGEPERPVRGRRVAIDLSDKDTKETPAETETTTRRKYDIT